MANPDRRAADEQAGKVQVRVLSDIFGSVRAPIGRKGDTIYVTPEEYELHRGSVSMLDGKLRGGSLSLVADEQIATKKKADVQAKTQANHDARKAQFVAQRKASEEARKAYAEKEAEGALARLEELNKKGGK